MHLVDHILSTSTSAGAGLVAAGAVALGLRRLRGAVGDRLVPLMGVMSACLFAAQMVKFPVLPGTSGHLLGGVLAAVVLGPWAGMLVMTVVLVAQCLLFYDGGVTALGANVVNMAVAGSLLGYLPYAAIRRLVAGPGGQVAGAAVAAWLSVVLSAALCGLELSASGVAPLGVVLPALVLIHSLIGLGEALITGLVVAFVLRVQPEMLYTAGGSAAGARQWRRLVLAGLPAALLVAFFLSPLASAAPDGLEYVAEQLGFDRSQPPRVLSAPLPDYTVPGVGSASLATAMAGLAGALAAFAAAWAVARALRFRPPE